MPYKDKMRGAEENKRYLKAWYQRNRAARLKVSRDRRKELRAWWWDYKSSLKCNRCGEDHPATLDFHHIDGKARREDGVAALMQSGCSKDRILKEIAKCEVLCANCHRKEHYIEYEAGA